MKKVFLDIVPVLVGILLALLINNWRQTKSEQDYIENSIGFIIQENTENIKELKYALKRQAMFMDTLLVYVDDDQYTLKDVLQRAQGVYTPDLKSTTWQFLVQDSKHTLVPYEMINRLAEIGKYEKLVERYNTKLGDIIFQQAFFEDPKLKLVAMSLFSDFSPVQNTLIQELESFNEFARENYNITEPKKEK